MIHTTLPNEFNPRFTVVSCYIECNGKILLLLRHDSKTEGNKWGAPAGKIDGNESEQQAILREVKEETGLDIGPTQLDYLTKVYVRYPEYDFVYHMFRTRIPMEKEPRISLHANEHKDYRWVEPKDALCLDLVPGLDACIKMFYPV